MELKDLKPEDYEYKSSFSPKFVCFNCDIMSAEIYALNREIRYKAPYKSRWLCPKCYDKLFKRKWKQNIETGELLHV